MVGVARWSEYRRRPRTGSRRSSGGRCRTTSSPSVPRRSRFARRSAVLAKIYTPEEMMQADNHEPAPKPRQEADLVPLLQASVEQNDRRAYQDLCDRVDAAGAVAALAMSSAATKAARSKRLTKEQYDSIKQAYAKKKALPADAAPSKPAEDDGPAHEANEAEAEAMAAQFDE